MFQQQRKMKIELWADGSVAGAGTLQMVLDPTDAM
jgi:hypothetical protein